MSRAYDLITDRIIELLEQGTVPWHRPWGSPEEAPRNLNSGRCYRGINAFLLSAAHYGSPYWVTFRQAKERGGHVNKGEKGYPCVYWNFSEHVNKETGEVENRPFLKRYTVFNVHQCSDLPSPEVEFPERPFSPIEECERIIQAMPQPPTISHTSTKSSYNPRTDTIGLPRKEWFHSDEEYYSVLFHEVIHSTGHQTRLNRKGITEPIVFGSRTYSKEELVAEMGAAFLCGHSGIENKVIDNSAAYIDSWLGRLKKDNRLVISAAGQAQKGADWVLGFDGATV